MECKGRMHKWKGGPGKGHRCVNCGKMYGTRTRKAKPAPPAQAQKTLRKQTAARFAPTPVPTPAPTPAPAPAGHDPLLSLWAQGSAQEDPAPEDLDIQTPADIDDDDDDDDEGEDQLDHEDDAEEVESLGSFAEWLAPVLPDAFIAACEWVIKRGGRVPEPVDAAWRGRVETCVTLVAKKRLPKFEVSPEAGLGISAGVIFGQMRIGAKKKPEEPTPGTRLRSVPMPPPPTTTEGPPLATAAPPIGVQDTDASAPAHLSIVTDSPQEPGALETLDGGFAPDADFPGLDV